MKQSNFLNSFFFGNRNINSIFNHRLNQSSTSTEIPLIFTIKDFSDSPETGEVVNCVLDLDDKQTINFKFGLNADTPQDITSRLVIQSLTLNTL